MSWPQPHPPRRHISWDRVVRRTWADAKPLARSAFVDVTPAIFAVLIALGLHHWLRGPSSFERDLLALLGGVTVYVIVAVLLNAIRMPRTMREDWKTWTEHPSRENVVLNLAATCPEKIKCVDALCEVTTPTGVKTFRAAFLLNGAPSSELPAFGNYPGDFPGGVVQQGVHRARWLIQEDLDNDVWIEVAAHNFIFSPPVQLPDDVSEA